MVFAGALCFLLYGNARCQAPSANLRRRVGAICFGSVVVGYLVDPASSHMLVSKIKPCMCKYKRLNRETANGSLNQL